MADTHDFASLHGSSRKPSLVKIGASLAVAGTIIGTLVFVMGCFGFGAAFALSPIPLALGTIGLALILIGGLCQHATDVEDTHTLAGLMLSIAVICGALLEIAIWYGKPLFWGATGT